jgi:DNA processing protein
MITAKLSADQGKKVFATPSPIHNPLAQGCHYLINQGAKLVSSVK